MDESVGTSCGALGEIDWGSSGGLLNELSRLLDGLPSGPGWMEEALYGSSGYINRDQAAEREYWATKEEKAAHESRCCGGGEASAVPVVQEPRRDRRYGGRMVCLYCLWYGPAKPASWNGPCEHVVRAIEEWQSQASPSLQPGSLLQIISDGYSRKNDTDRYPSGARKFASHLRWRKQRLARHHRRAAVGDGDV